MFLTVPAYCSSSLTCSSVCLFVYENDFTCVLMVLVGGTPPWIFYLFIYFFSQRTGLFIGGYSSIAHPLFFWSCKGLRPRVLLSFVRREEGGSKGIGSSFEIYLEVNRRAFRVDKAVSIAIQLTCTCSVWYDVHP